MGELVKYKTQRDFSLFFKDGDERTAFASAVKDLKVRAALIVGVCSVCGVCGVYDADLSSQFPVARAHGVLCTVFSAVVGLSRSVSLSHSLSHFCFWPSLSGSVSGCLCVCVSVCLLSLSLSPSLSLPLCVSLKGIHKTTTDHAHRESADATARPTSLPRKAATKHAMVRRGDEKRREETRRDEKRREEMRDEEMRDEAYGITFIDGCITVQLA